MVEHLHFPAILLGMIFLGVCNGLNVCVTPKVICEILTSKVMLLEAEAFGEVTGL